MSDDRVRTDPFERIESGPEMRGATGEPRPAPPPRHRLLRPWVVAGTLVLVLGAFQVPSHERDPGPRGLGIGAVAGGLLMIGLGVRRQRSGL